MKKKKPSEPVYKSPTPEEALKLGAEAWEQAKKAEAKAQAECQRSKQREIEKNEELAGEEIFKKLPEDEQTRLRTQSLVEGRSHNEMLRDIAASAKAASAKQHGNDPHPKAPDPGVVQTISEERKTKQAESSKRFAMLCIAYLRSLD